MKIAKLLISLLIILIFVSCSQKTEKITDLAQLTNKRICVLTGSAGDLAARKNFPDAKFQDMVVAADAAYSVKISKSDAFIFDKSVLTKITKTDDALTVLSKPVAQVEIAIAVNKDSNGLLSQLSAALLQLKNDGTLNTMQNKWIENEYKTVPELPKIKNTSGNGVLKMGTCATVEPMTFMYINKLTGFDIELALRLGEILDMKVEILDMSFEGLIPALQSGKIDFALSNFNVTEERKKSIAFTVPYFVNDISALVRK